MILDEAAQSARAIASFNGFLEPTRLTQEGQSGRI